MRILLVPSWYPRPGAEHPGSFFREQALMLAGSGHEVEVLAVETAPLGGGRRRGARPGGTARASLEDGIRVTRMLLPSMPRPLGALERRIHRRMISRAARLIEERGAPRIVHAHTVFPGGTAGALLARRWGAPLVITEHRPSTIDSPAFAARAGLIEEAVGEAALVSTVSTGFARALAARYPGTEWLPLELPVPDAFFEAARSRREAGAPVHFAHVSHIDANKRVLETCRAFLDAFPEPGQALLRIAGGSPASVDALRAAIGGEHPSIEFLGRLDRAGVVSLLADSDVFVLASALEAGGTVFSEAQAAGARILATATWAGRFAVEGADGAEERGGITPGRRNGELVPVDDAPALVEAMRRIADPAGYATPEEIRERARARYSEESFTSRWGRLYSALVDGARPGLGAGEHEGAPSAPPAPAPPGEGPAPLEEAPGTAQEKRIP